MRFCYRARPMRTSRSARRLLFALGGIVLVGGLVATILRPSVVEPEPILVEAGLPDEAAPEPEPPPLEEVEIVIQRNDTLSGALARAELAEADFRGVLSALLEEVDARRIRPGHRLALRRDLDGAVVDGVWRTSPVDLVDLSVDLDEEGNRRYVASRRELDLRVAAERVEVEIESSLYEAFLSAGEDPALAVLASEVLAWEIDFYRDVRKGDRMELLVEKVTHEGAFVRYGDLLAVRYTGAGASREFFRYAYGDKSGWFDVEGRSARRAFLKQPLPLVRITSSYGNRRHPILGYMKKHEGVDYGAPTGTPVWAVGDGVVSFAGRKGANGLLVTVRHSNGYTSHYAHLSRIDVKQGARVKQKQVIGRVGATGRATGPHLHFAISQGGKFVNPLTLRFPAGDPIPAKERDDFLVALEPLRTQLDHGALFATNDP